jgi:hypothetical protein
MKVTYTLEFENQEDRKFFEEIILKWGYWVLD